MFLTVVGAPAMSMTSHTIKADDAQKKKRRKIALGVAAGAATIAAGAVAYKNRANISKSFNQIRGKSATATTAQTKNTQTKTTSPERRGATKQVKTDNKPMETKPATAPNTTVPVSTVPTNSKTASQSEAPQTRPLLSNSKSTEGAIYNEKGVGVSNKAPKGAQPRAPKDSTNKTQAPKNTEAPAPAPAPTKTEVQAPASAPQSEAPQTRPKTFAEMKRDGDLVYNAQGAAGNKNAPQAPKFDPEKMQKRPNIAKPDATKESAPAPAPEPVKSPPVPAQSQSLEQQLQEAQAKLKKAPPQQETAARKAAEEAQKMAELQRKQDSGKKLTRHEVNSLQTYKMASALKGRTPAIS